MSTGSNYWFCSVLNVTYGSVPVLDPRYGTDNATIAACCAILQGTIGTAMVSNTTSPLGSGSGVNPGTMGCGWSTPVGPAGGTPPDWAWGSCAATTQQDGNQWGCITTQEASLVNPQPFASDDKTKTTSANGASSATAAGSTSTGSTASNTPSQSAASPVMHFGTVGVAFIVSSLALSVMCAV